MLEFRVMERYTYSPKDAYVPYKEVEPRDAMVVAQADSIKATLVELKIGYIPVRQDIYRRDADYYKERKTIAIAGMSEIPVALAVSGGTKKGEAWKNTAVLLVAPINRGSGFLTDSKGQLFTDSFWVYENGVMKYVQPSKPIPVDYVSTIFDEKRDQAHIGKVNEGRKKIYDVASNKIRTKALLERHGIKVPNGFVIQSNTDVLEQFDQYVNSTPNAKGYVHKTGTGSHGEGVSIFRRDQIDEMRLYIEDHFSWNEEFSIVEERIVPPPLDSLKAKRFKIPKKAAVDYNFRILVTLSKQPTAIDGEIRFKKDDTAPVNISYEYGGAKAGLLDLLGNESEVLELYDLAQRSTKIVMEEAGVEEVEGAIAGVDIIKGEDGFYVLEVNAGEAVGGFGTLTRLHRAQLASVKDIMLPLWEEQAQQNFLNRRDFDQADIQRLPLNKTDIDDIWNAFNASNNYSKLWNMLLTLGHTYEDQNFILHSMMYLVSKTNDFLTAKRYVEKGIARNDQNYQMYLYRLGELYRMVYRAKKTDEVFPGTKDENPEDIF